MYVEWVGHQQFTIEFITGLVMGPFEFNQSMESIWKFQHTKEPQFWVILDCEDPEDPEVLKVSAAMHELQGFNIEELTGAVQCG